MDAIVDAKGGFGAFGDGVFGGGDWYGDVVVSRGGVWSWGGEIFALDADDFVVGGVVVVLAGFEEEDFVADFDGGVCELESDVGGAFVGDVAGDVEVFDALLHGLPGGDFVVEPVVDGREANAEFVGELLLRPAGGG